MKATWKQLFAMSLLIMAVGCGGGGGGGSSSNYSSAYTGTALTGTNLQYMNELQAYMNAAEPVMTLRRYAKVAQTISASTSTSSCPGTVKKILGIFSVCVYSSGSSASGTNGAVAYFLAGPNASGDYNLPVYCPTVSPYTACSSGSPLIYAGKGANTALIAALSGQGNLLVLQSITKSGTVYQISYGTSTLGTASSVVYTVDTSLHSMYNPVQTVNTTALTNEYVSWF
jgi:hypothetical protein